MRETLIDEGRLRRLFKEVLVETLVVQDFRPLSREEIHAR